MQDDPICEADPLPRFPAGEYDVRCFQARQYRDPQFKRWVCKLDCHFLTESIDVAGFLNLGNGPKPKAGRRSEYWRVWVMANRQQPRKRQTLGREVFVDKIFRVRIGDTERTHDGKLHSEAAKYSTIKEFVACSGP